MEDHHSRSEHSGMKIELCGTDSLGFLFSEDEQLFDRCILLHTTFIPYREFEQVLAMVTGWQKISAKWYYFESGGAMKTGWLHIPPRKNSLTGEV